MDLVAESQTYRFGDFELDLGAHLLRLRGEPVRLERRPFDLLVLLVTRHGLLVPREDIIASLWPGNVVIDFDTGLNTLVRKVRQALGDSPDNPAFIETVAGLGYRFIAAVTQPEKTPTAGTNPQAAAAGEVGSGGNRLRLRTVSIIAALLLVAVATGIWYAANREPSRVSIAVLPFENLTGNSELDYLAAGLAEETNASLTQIDLKNLRLIGRVSAQAFATSNKPLSQVGRELGVDFVVASSLRAEQSKIRVTSRLVRVVDNEQMWTASFDREVTSSLGLQRELSIAIAEQVRLRLSPEVTAAMMRRQTLNPEAYDLYLQGRYQWTLLTRESSRRAVELFQKAIVKDPEYALAWAGIAQVLSTAPITGDADPVFVFARARDALQRAVQYGAELTEVQYALGHFHLIMDWDWPAAENALRKAVAIDPNNAIAYLFLGHVRSQSGDQVEAREFVRRARELDPLFSHTFAISSQVAFQARDFPLALELARQAIAINPEGWVGYLQLGQTLAELGDYTEAIAAFDSAKLYSGGNSKADSFRANVLARSGRANEAREVIAELQTKAQERYVPPYAIALIYAGLSDHQAALDWLERAYVVRDVHMFFLPVDPRWDALRDDPRFQALIKRSRFCGRNAALVAGRCQPAEPMEVADERILPALDPVNAYSEIASANIDGIWTAKASAIGGDKTISGLVKFTGPAGKTRQMGMCLVQRHGSEADAVACDTVDDCGSAPAELPAGGSRYCLAPTGTGQKFCHYRPGQSEDYCAASPALDLAPVAPGFYRVDAAAAPGTQWHAIACFNICVAIPRTMSEPATVR